MFDFVKKWRDKIIALVETKYRLMQLNLIEHVSKLMGNIVLLISFIFIGFGFFLFLGLGLAEFFAYYWESRIAGYFSVAILFFIFFLILFSLRKKILTGLGNLFIKVLTEKDPDIQNP